MSEQKYGYKGKDLTTLILLKIEHVVGLIADRENRSFDECYPEFVSSRTYANLTSTDTLLWSESAEFIVDDYYGESEGVSLDKTIVFERLPV
jgi:phospholipase C